MKQSNLNNVTIVGNLVREAEVRYIANGTPVAQFTIANNVMLGDKEATSWITVKAWRGWAEKMNQYKKGNSLLVVGQLRTDSWEDRKTGAKRTSTYVLANYITSAFISERTEERQTSRRREPEPMEPEEPESDDGDVPF